MGGRATIRKRRKRRQAKMVLRTRGKFKINHKARHGRSGSYMKGK
jgi:hypothetical protein